MGGLTALAGICAYDADLQGVAQRYFFHALRMAKAYADALRRLGDLTAARAYAERSVAAAGQSHVRGQVHRLATLATILAGQGDADAAAGIAGQMLDKAAGMESCRIADRIAAVRDAVTAVSDGAAARQLSERAGDVLGLPM